jgi:L-asparaginase
VLGRSTNFARENGFGSFSTETPQRRAEYEAVKITWNWNCHVALDQNGKLQ